MANNKKQTSKQIASLASDILKDQNASQIQKSLAGSALSQSKSKHQTGAEMEDVASKVLQSSKYNDTTKSLAGSILSQSNKKRLFSNNHISLKPVDSPLRAFCLYARQILAKLLSRWQNDCVLPVSMREKFNQPVTIDSQKSIGGSIDEATGTIRIN